MLEAMQEYEASETKSGRSSELTLKAQILLALTYWRECRTLHHIGISFSVHESSASRIVRKVESILIHSARFELPRKLPHVESYYINWSAVIIDATKTPVERPKKPKTVLH